MTNPISKFSLFLLKWAAVPLLTFLLAGLVTRQVLRAKQGGDARKYEKSMSESVKSFEAGDRVGALNHLQAASKVVPNDPKQNLDLANKLGSLGNHQQAAGQMEIMLRNHSDGQTSTNLARLVEYYAEHGDLKSGRRILNTELLAKWPNSWPTEFICGKIGLKEATTQADVEKAAQHFRKAVELNGDHLPSQTHLGIAYWRLGQFEKAEPLLRAVLGKEPSNLVVMYHLGEVLRQLGKADESRKYLDEHQRISQLDQRRKHIEVQNSVGKPRPDEILELGKIYGQLGDFQKAANAFRAYTQLKPKDAEGQRELAQACLKLNDKEGARVASELADALSQVATAPANR